MSEEDDTVDVRCPRCKKMVRVSKAKAEAEMRVVCPNGHEIPLAKAL